MLSSTGRFGSTSLTRSSRLSHSATRHSAVSHHRFEDATYYKPCETDVLLPSGRMPLAFLRALVSRMVAEGSAEYDPPVKGKAPPTGALIHWKRPEEWANIIYSWVSNHYSKRELLRSRARAERSHCDGLNVCADQGMWLNRQHHDTLRTGRRR